MLVLLFSSLSAVAFLVEHLFPKRREILVWARRISFGLTCLFFLLALVDLSKSRLPFDELVCSDIAVDAYYHVPEDKAYELVQRQRCSNRSDHSVRDLPDLRDGYYEKIPNWNVDGDVLRGPDGLRLLFLNVGQAEYSNYIGEQTVYLYWRKAEFKPPLPSGADVDMVYRISAKGIPIESGAFSNGTVFYRGVDFDTLVFHMTIHAPGGFHVDPLDWGVIDSGGHRDSNETDRQDAPQVTGAGGDLVWNVVLARKHLSYMIKYKIRPYEWEK